MQKAKHLYLLASHNYSLIKTKRLSSHYSAHLFAGLYDYEGVKLVEKKPDSSGVLVYFDYLTPIEVCPTVAAYRVNKVAFQKRSAVRVYDYYDTCKLHLG